MSAHLSRLRLFQRHLRSLFWVWVWVWDWVHTPPHTLLHTLLSFSPPSFHTISLSLAFTSVLLFHTISARPPKQPCMVRTFPKVHTRPRLAYALRAEVTVIILNQVPINNNTSSSDPTWGLELELVTPCTNDWCRSSPGVSMTPGDIESELRRARAPVCY